MLIVRRRTVADRNEDGSHTHSVVRTARVFMNLVCLGKKNKKRLKMFDSLAE
jgi:hypothetical protein